MTISEIIINVKNQYYISGFQQNLIPSVAPLARNTAWIRSGMLAIAILILCKGSASHSFRAIRPSSTSFSSCPEPRNGCLSTWYISRRTS